MGPGRVPDFLREMALVKELWDLRTDMKSDLLKPERLITVWAAQTTPPPGMIQGFQQFEFSYPCVIIPLTQPLTDTSGTATGKLFANICEPPQTPPDGPFFARHSRGGMLWIPFPGKWWLYYDGPLDTRLPCMVVDDTCGMAQHMMSKYSCWIRDFEINVLNPGPTTILGDNQFRDGAVLQNQGTVDLWIRPGTTGLKPAAVSNGLIIPPRETVDLGAEGLNYKGAVNGAPDGAACPVHVLEIFS